MEDFPMEQNPSYEELMQRVKELEKEALESKRSGESVHDGHAQLVSIFDSMDERVYVADPETYEILYVNPAAIRVFGEDIVGKKCHMVFQGLEAPCDFCTNHLIFGENLGKSHVREFQDKKDGRWYHYRDRGIQWRDGRIVRCEIARDIHEHKQAEEALRKSEENYRSLVENISEVIYEIDRKGIITYVSPAVEPLSGFAPPEIIGRDFREFVAQEDLEHVKQRFEEALAGQFKLTEYRMPGRHGVYVWVRAFTRPVLKEGAVVGLQGMLMDITEYKKAERALRESEARYRELVETMNEGLSIVDEHKIRTYGNPRLCEILGYDQSEITGVRATKPLDGRNTTIWEKQFEKRRKGDSGSYEITWTRKDGSKVPTILSPRPLFDGEGNFRGSLSVITDVSDLKRAEQELKQREKELQVKSDNLEEANAALKVLLAMRARDKIQLEEKVLFNVKEIINPYVEKLKKTSLDDRQATYLNILESNLSNIAASFSHALHFKYANLTPAEIQIAGLIRDGKTTKEIADLLNLSSRTIESHRKNIRRKMGLTDKKMNLRTTLLSLR
jgi:PAS domain S-box-containing protein